MAFKWNYSVEYLVIYNHIQLFKKIHNLISFNWIFLKKDRQDYYSDERGIYLAVTNNSALPLTNYEGIKLSVGQATYAKISRTFITHLPSPFSDCRIDVSSASSNDNPIYKRTLELNQYSVDLCYDLCLQRDFINLQCNCSDPSLAPFNVTIPVCNTTPLLNCSKNVRDQFDNVNDIDEACAKYCPNPCNEYNYELSTSISDYPTDYYFEILKNSTELYSKFKTYLNEINKTNLNEIESIVSNSILKVNVFYGDLSYVLISDIQAITADVWFGTVGNWNS